MTIGATTTGAGVAQALRNEFKQAFDSAKKTYKETGHVAGISQDYQSEDGNVTFRLSGRVLSDGSETLEASYRIDGAEGKALSDFLDRGIDNSTGLRYAPGTQYGGRGGSASTEKISGLEDIEAFEDTVAESALATQDEQNSQTLQYGLGPGQFTTSLEEYRAYNRRMDSLREATIKVADQLGIKDPQKEAEFTAALQKSLIGIVGGNDNTDISKLLEFAKPDELKKALQSAKGRDPAIDKLIKLLDSHVASHGAATQSNVVPRQGRLNLFV